MLLARDYPQSLPAAREGTTYFQFPTLRNRPGRGLPSSEEEEVIS